MEIQKRVTDAKKQRRLYGENPRSALLYNRIIL